MIWNYIICIVLIIIVSSIYSIHSIQINRIEGFSSKHIVLLGDSILKNDTYVKSNQNITKLLEQKGYVINCLAKDNALVENMYSQINHFKDINTDAYYVISAGGNNILQHRDMDVAFREYKHFVTRLAKYILRDKIILCTIYYPPTYTHYFTKIKEWNTELITFAKDKYKLLRVDKFMNEDSDFTHRIEPSYIGSKKIVYYLNNIL